MFNFKTYYSLSCENDKHDITFLWNRLDEMSDVIVDFLDKLPGRIAQRAADAGESLEDAPQWIKDPGPGAPDPDFSDTLLTIVRKSLAEEIPSEKLRMALEPHLISLVMSKYNRNN